MAFSDAILQLDISPLWAILFFIMLILLGIDSEFGTLEAVIGPLMELGAFPKKMRKEVVTGKFLALYSYSWSRNTST
jgi:solute carrier family 6 amino acid/orphan transporter-like 15/16/17/18/20